MTPPLFGLVLAGGASTRMQRDKAVIAYHGQPQLRWAFDLLSQVCAATFVSVRPDQRDEPTRAQFPQIVDLQPGTGPIAGISAALSAHPKAAWLVVACDLPFVTEQTLRHLIERRAPEKAATAFRSSHDGLPEPLCAIWEPSAREPVLAYIAGGKQCPRKLLINSPNVQLLDLPETGALDNVNTQEELRAAAATLDAVRPHPIPPPATGGGEEKSPPSHSLSSTERKRAALIEREVTAPTGVKGTAPSDGEGAAPTAGKGTAPTDGEGTPPTAGKGTAPSDGEGTAPTAGKGTAPTDGEGTPPTAEKETGRYSSSPPPHAGEGQGGGTRTSRKTLRVQYYAILREQAGRSDETLDTTAATAADLYAELRQRHPFQLSSSQLKVALNSQFSDWQTPLQHGDTVVFIPPVAGG